MGISSLTWAMKKRKISFFAQLMENETTSRLIMTRESSMEYVFGILGINSGNDCGTKSLALRRCRDEMTRIKEMERNERKNVSDIAKIIMRLLEDRLIGDNDETLRLIISSKNGMRELANNAETSFNRSMDAG